MKRRLLSLSAAILMALAAITSCSDNADVPVGLDADTQVLKQPIDNILVASTPVTSLISAVGALDSISLTTYDADSWYIDDVKNAILDGRLTYVGDYKTPDYEMITATGSPFFIYSTMLTDDVAAQLMFSLGTLPLMLGLGSVISALGRKFTRTVTTIGAMLVAVLGLAMLSQGGNLSGLFDFPMLLTVSAALSLAGIVSPLRFGHPAMRLCCMLLSACAVIAVLPISSALSVRSVGEAEIIDGVQVVRSTLQPGDYPDITVQAGMPVKWYIDAPDGSVNGCNYSSGRGYYVQEGSSLVCQNCHNRFTVDQIELQVGGCNPVPILSGDKTVTEDGVSISYELLEKYRVIFLNWKLAY